MMSDTPTYYTVSMPDGCPAVAAEMPESHKVRIVAVMVNTDLGHELAEELCAFKMKGKVRV